MSEQTVREALATLIATGLDIPIAPYAPAEIRSNAGYLEFGDPWLDFVGEGATFTVTLLRLKLVLVSPAVDWSNAMPWCSAKLALLRTTLNNATTVGGVRRPSLTTVSPGGLVGGKAFAVEATFTPLRLGAL